MPAGHNFMPAHMAADFQAKRYIPPHIKHDQYVASLYAKHDTTNTTAARAQRHQEHVERYFPVVSDEDMPLGGKDLAATNSGLLEIGWHSAPLASTNLHQTGALGDRNSAVASDLSLEEQLRPPPVATAARTVVAPDSRRVVSTDENVLAGKPWWACCLPNLAKDTAAAMPAFSFASTAEQMTAEPELREPVDATGEAQPSNEKPHAAKTSPKDVMALTGKVDSKRELLRPTVKEPPHKPQEPHRALPKERPISRQPSNSKLAKFLDEVAAKQDEVTCRTQPHEQPTLQPPASEPLPASPRKKYKPPRLDAPPKESSTTAWTPPAAAPELLNPVAEEALTDIPTNSGTAALPAVFSLFSSNPQAIIEEPANEKSRTPIHLRGRLPAAWTSPAKQGPRYLGDYGQLSELARLQGGNGGKAKGGLSFGRRRKSKQSQAPAAVASGSVEPDAVADETEEVVVGERKRTGDAEDPVPRGQAHAGEEGKAIAADAVRKGADEMNRQAQRVAMSLSAGLI